MRIELTLSLQDQLLDKAKYVFVSKEYSQNKGLSSKEEAVKEFIKRCRKG
jgi:hypothetical protein